MVKAFYSNGVLRLLTPLALTDGQVVRLTVHVDLPVAAQVEELDPYAGQWVALLGDQVIAHGFRLAAVRKAARDAGVEDPLFVSVRDNCLPFGGW
jgi:predicted DNA-binding antitoxin AbrB/MazE fold protein